MKVSPKCHVLYLFSFFPEDGTKTYVIVPFSSVLRFPFHHFAVLTTPRVNSSVREKTPIAL